MTTKSDQLLDAARDLFAREGFHATGIDRILHEAGVAKMTLYNNFGSKDALIAAVLDRTSLELIGQFRAWMSGSTDPFDRVILLFTGLGMWFEQPDCRGCVIQAASAEFSDPQSPVHRAARDHRDRVHGLLLELARDAECPNPDELATGLGLLLGGALSAVRLCRCRGPADAAARSAAVLLEHACTPFAGANPPSSR